MRWVLVCINFARVPVTSPRGAVGSESEFYLLRQPPPHVRQLIYRVGTFRAKTRQDSPHGLPTAATGGAAAWHTSLILRDLPLKERFTVVDTAPIPTPTPLRNPIRARAEKCLLTVARARSRKICFLPVGVDRENF